jgi:uridine kinase
MQTNPSAAPVIIGLAGGSGSGKTTVAHRVQERFPGRSVAIIPHDSYYLDQPDLDDDTRARTNYDHPQAFETELLVRQLGQLAAGEAVDKPVYDYARHRRSSLTEPVEPADIIFVEGILVLESAALRDRMDICLYVDVDADERFIRRLLRDTGQRGRTVGSVIDQYRNTVRPMHEQFVAPSRRHAHMIIPEGGHNSVAIDMICAKVQEILLRRGRTL